MFSRIAARAGQRGARARSSVAQLHVANFATTVAKATESSSARAVIRGGAIGVLGIGITCGTGIALALGGIGEGAIDQTHEYDNIDEYLGGQQKEDKDAADMQNDPNVERDDFGRPLDKNNPGKMEALGREAKSLLQLDVHDGARLQLATPLVAQNTKYFGFTQHVWMGTSQLGPNTRGMYEFTTQLQTENVVMVARLDSMYRLTGRCIGMLTKRWMGKLIFVLAPNTGMQEQGMLQADYSGSDFSIASELTSEYCRASYLQTVFPRLSMGAELIHAFANGQTPATVCASYKGDSEKYLATFQSMGVLTMSYSNKISKNFDFASEMGVNVMEGKSVTSAGLKYNMQDKTKGLYNVSCDSNLNVSVTYSSELNPGVRLAFCGAASHLKEPTATYTFGMCMTIG